MTSSLVRRTLAAAAATAALLALAGCGGDDSGDSAADKAAASSTASPTQESEESGDVDAGAGETISGEQFADLLRTALDQATTAHMSMDLGGAGTAEGDADYTTTPPDLAMRMSMAELGGEVEVRIVDGTMYLQGETFGDKWVSVDLDDPNNPLGSLGGQLDPTKQLEAFGAAVTEATHTGADEVDGETLEHYTATVDTEKLLQQLPDEAAGQPGLPDTMQQEWWFDDEGRIRKFSSDFGGTGTIDLSLSDWGADVSIEAPPSDEVTTMPGAGA